MLRSCMSIRSRLVGGNFMVFSMFFMGFTSAFARCFHDLGCLFEPGSCLANMFFFAGSRGKISMIFELEICWKEK